MSEKQIPDAFHPGEYILDGLEALEWSQLDLAEVLGRPANVVNEIIKGKRSISVELAQELGKVFDTSAQLWLNLQSAYNLATAVAAGKDDVARRSRLFKQAPVREMINRGWIDGSNDLEVLETQVTEFLKPCSHAARKSAPYGEVSPAQRAWLSAAATLAEGQDCDVRYTKARLAKGLEDLRALVTVADRVREAPTALARCGVRFVVVKHLSKTKIDGACFWLDKQSPVVALSLRYGELDKFWFNLLHELGHVMAGDGRDEPVVETLYDSDANHDKSERPDCEGKADQFATGFLVDQNALEEFIADERPRYSAKKIIALALSLMVHPALIVGQLHHRGEVPFKNMRKLIPNIRGIITEAAISDGWE